MDKKLSVTSNYPNIRGIYVECGVNEGRPAYSRDASPSTWIFFSSQFGNGPSWYFAKSLPGKGSMSSLSRSLDDAATPEEAQWPSSDVLDIQEDRGIRAEPIPQNCKSCESFADLVHGLRCPSCDASVNKHALQGLTLLHNCMDKATLKRLATALVEGDNEIKLKLEQAVLAYECQDPCPLIFSEPPSEVQVTSGTTNLVCHAFGAGDVALAYQWCKNGIPIPRAVRPRLVLSGGNPQDEGLYECKVSAGPISVSSHACQVTVVPADSSSRTDFESALLRASEAQHLEQFEKALCLFAEVAKDAVGDERTQAMAYFRRAQLLCKLGRLTEAFHDSTCAVRILPEFADVHALRGALASKLDLLAEAVSSWETAEFLGGIPEAAREAQTCRGRLESFFAERRKTNENGTSDRNSRRTSHGTFFEREGKTHGNGYASRNENLLQRHLDVLGLSCDARGAPPAREVICTAYRRLALQMHPDKPGGSKAAFQSLQAAYEAALKEILS